MSPDLVSLDPALPSLGVDLGVRKALRRSCALRTEPHKEKLLQRELYSQLEFRWRGRSVRPGSA